VAARGRPAVLGVIVEREDEDRLVLTLDGVLDSTTVHLVDVALRAATPDVREVVLDLSSLRDLGTGGAGALALAHCDLAETGREVVVRGASPAVRERLGRASRELGRGMERLLAAVVTAPAALPTERA